MITLKPAKRVLVLQSLLVALLYLSLQSGVFYLQLSATIHARLSSLLLALTLIGGGGFLVYSFLWRLTSVFTISAECVSASIGILSRSHIRIPLNRIVDYQVSRPLLERILGLGAIHIDTAGSEELIMPQISRREITTALKQLDSLLNKEQYRSDTSSGMKPALKEVPLSI